MSSCTSVKFFTMLSEPEGYEWAKAAMDRYRTGTQKRAREVPVNARHSYGGDVGTGATVSQGDLGQCICGRPSALSYTSLCGLDD